MTQLFLDGKEVVVKNNTSIKLILENPFFTKAGSSTLSIVLPMHIEQNIKVLGHINRLDYKHKAITLPATIKVGNKTLITGEAVVIEVTEEYVKVQILGGTSLMNFYNKIEEIFIDELDLGKWGMSYIDISQTAKTTYSFFYNTIWTAYITDVTMVGHEEAQRRLREKLFGQDNEWVAFPIYNETSSVMCNDWIVKHQAKSSGHIYSLAPWDNIFDLNQDYVSEPNGYPQIRFAIQPYLIPMIERVFNSLGYTCDMSYLSKNELFSKIFIACANEKAERNKALPHWTVKDFITQLEYFFGVVFDVDEDKKHINIMRRIDYINRDLVKIDNILEEFSISNNDSKNILSTSNVGYEEVDPFTRIEPWILENAKYKHYATYDDFLKDESSYYDGAYTDAYYNAYKGYIIVIDDTQEMFVYRKRIDALDFTSGMTNINFFRDRIIKDANSDLDIEIKIVPVKLENEYNVLVFDSTGVQNLETIKYRFTGKKYYMSTLDYSVRTWEEEIDRTEENFIKCVEDAITGNEDDGKESGKDILPVAINCGAYSKHSLFNDTQLLKYPKPIVYSLGDDEDYNGKAIQSYGLNLNEGSPVYSLATEVFSAEPLVNTDNKYCIKFITKEILNPRYKFLIRNQVYLCEKIEYQIKDTGVEKLVTGYFYRLEE